MQFEKEELYYYITLCCVMLNIFHCILNSSEIQMKNFPILRSVKLSDKNFFWHAETNQ